MSTGIQLVLPPLDDGSCGISRSGSFPPLGLLSIATWLKCKHGLDAEVLDGEVLSFTEIQERLRGAVVGISVSQLTYRNALRLASSAKRFGSMVVFGGHHATALAETILKARPDVDVVVVGDGEEAFAGLATGTPFAAVPNLVWRDCDGEVRRSVLKNVDPTLIPPPDRSRLKLTPYFDAFRRQNPNKTFSRPFAVWSQKGCAWRDASGGCTYCARTDTGWRSRDPEAVWTEIAELCNRFGADYIWELSDDILSNRNWFQRFVNAKPRSVNPAFMFYARPSNVDQYAADSFAALGAYEVFLGIESGDDRLLRLARRGTNAAASLRATRLLGERGIRVFPSFVLGLEGETPSSLLRSEKHLREILSLAPVDAVAVCRFMPLPGSSAFTRLRAEIAPTGEDRLADHLDLASLQEEWVARFCHVSLEEINETRARMISLTPVHSGMGIAPILARVHVGLSPAIT